MINRRILHWFLAVLLIEGVLVYYRFRKISPTVDLFPCIVIPSSSRFQFETSEVCQSWRKLAGDYQKSVQTSNTGSVARRQLAFACTENTLVSGVNGLGPGNGRVCAVHAAVLPKMADLDGILAGGKDNDDDDDDASMPAEAKKGEKGRPLSARRLGQLTFLRPWRDQDDGDGSDGGKEKSSRRSALVGSLAKVQRFKGGPERALVLAPLARKFELVGGIGVGGGAGGKAGVRLRKARDPGDGPGEALVWGGAHGSRRGIGGMSGDLGVGHSLDGDGGGGVGGGGGGSDDYDGTCATVVNATAVLVRFDGWNPFHQMVLTFPHLFFTLQALASGALDTTTTTTSPITTGTASSVVENGAQDTTTSSSSLSEFDFETNQQQHHKHQQQQQQHLRNWVPIIDGVPPELAAEVGLIALILI
jgi:hypothetical protein